ncbi:MAG: DMT family transporter [Candidatus Pacebacteria bacterium]|nr:DMT family transporter [Candidatus Paceibacterota bacterium]
MHGSISKIITIKTRSVTTDLYRSVGWKLLSVGLFMLMNSLIKAVSPTIPTGEIILSRSLFGLIPIIILIYTTGEKSGDSPRLYGWAVLRTTHPWLHLRRCFFGVIGMYCGFLALRFLPLADAMVLQFTAPILTGILAVPLLGELFNRKRFIAVAVGFIGTIFIIFPWGWGVSWSPTTLDSWGIVFGLGWGISTSLAMISIAKMNSTEPGMRIVAYFMLAGTLVGLVSLVFDAVVPTPRELIFLLAIGVCGGLAQLFMTYAYLRAPASVIMPLDYLSLVLAMGIGLVFFNEIPTFATVLGSLLVSLSGVFIVLNTAGMQIKGVKNLNLRGFWLKKP